jgi:hypothetical protein
VVSKPARVVLALLLSTAGCSDARTDEDTRHMKTDFIDVRLGELSQGGPPIVVVAADAGSTPAERYRQGARAAASQPAGKPLVAIVRSGPLSTPDKIQVTDSSTDGKTFRLTLDVRHYSGPISANVERETLVQAELGSLSPGRYLVVVTRTTLEFQDPQHPERTANPTKVEERLEFDVR